MYTYIHTYMYAYRCTYVHMYKRTYVQPFRVLLVHRAICIVHVCPNACPLMISVQALSVYGSESQITEERTPAIFENLWEISRQIR